MMIKSCTAIVILILWLSAMNLADSRIDRTFLNTSNNWFDVVQLVTNHEMDSVRTKSNRNSIEPNDVCKVYQDSYPLSVIKCNGGNEITINNNKFLTKSIVLGSRAKNFDDLLNSASLTDQLSQEYVKGDVKTKPDVNQDPGRIRCYDFFDAMYGATEPEVRKNLTTVHWVDGTKLLITTKNNISKHLQSVADELKQLPSNFRKYLNRPGGTFNYRTIAQTNRKSAHSYGIAIDINVQHSHYWLNSPQKYGRIVYQNSIPIEIVKVFEKHGFIWGGKWYHYDTMHFEYRPELCKPECLCGL
jgi:peptidoglycan LD-endopeptidase CwlK